MRLRGALFLFALFLVAAPALKSLGADTEKTITPLLYPIESDEKVDKRRADTNLPPIESLVPAATSTYQSPFGIEAAGSPRQPIESEPLRVATPSTAIRVNVSRPASGTAPVAADDTATPEPTDDESLTAPVTITADSETVEPEPEPEEATETPDIAIAVSTAPIAILTPADATTAPQILASAQNSLDNLHFFGNSSIIYQKYDVTGNRTQFLSESGLSYSKQFQQTILLGIRGRIDDRILIDSQFQSQPFMDKTFYVNASSRSGLAHLGDTGIRFMGGEMTSFRKTIRGLDYQYHDGPWSFQAAASKQKSKTSAESFNGRNIRGPYALRATSIVEGSEVIRINGTVVPPTAYSIDYFLGQITFQGILDPSETVEVSYESSLFASIKTGSLRGAGIGYRPASGRFDLNASYVEEGSNRVDDPILISFSRDFTAADFASSGLTVRFDVKRLQKYSESLSLIRGAVSSTIPATSYTIDYALGNVTFATATIAALAVNDRIKIAFRYYNPRYIQWIVGEELRGENKVEFKLSHETIYSGAEIVELYENGSLSRQLLPGTDKDYVIYEQNNTIRFNSSLIPSAAANRFVRISYEIVPINAPAHVTQKHTVSDLWGTLNLGKNVSLQAEASSSTSDPGQKTIQTLEEQVATVIDSTRRAYSLQQSIINGSEEIYFNDTLAPNARQFAGRDYMIENDGRTLRFLHDLPLNTTIIANYRYQPSIIGIDPGNGRAARLLADARFRTLTYAGEFMSKNRFFSPMTNYNNLETRRALNRFSWTPLPRLSLSLGLNRYTSAVDLGPGGSVTRRQNAFGLGYTFGRDVVLSLSLENQSLSDDRPAHTVDNRRLTRGVSIAAPLDSRGRLTLSLGHNRRETTDNTLRTSPRMLTNNNITVGFRSSPRFNMTVSTARQEIDSKSHPTAGLAGFSTTNNLTSLNTMWLPTRLLTLGASVDTQRISDSRPATPRASFDTIRASITSKPFGFVRSAGLNFTRDDRSDQISGDTRSDIFSSSLTAGVMRDIFITPSLTTTRSQVGGTSSTNDRTAALRAEYRPAAATGVTAAVAYNNTNRRNATRADKTAVWVSGASRDSQTLFSVLWRINALASVNSVYSVGQSSGASSTRRNTLTEEFRYKVRDRVNTRLLFNLENIPSAGTKKRILEFEANTPISDRFTLAANFRNQKFQSSNSAANYAGNLFTTRLDINF